MFQHIMIATDGSPTIEHATEYAATLFPSSTFHVLSIINTSDHSVPMTDMLMESVKKAAEGFVERDSKTLEKMGAKVQHKDILSGTPSKEIMKYIQENHIELLVMARSGTDCAVHLGATCINILEISHCAILMVPNEAPIKAPKIIFNPTTGSHYSMSASELAVVVADNFGAELRTTYVGKHDPRVILRTVEARAQKLDVHFRGKTSRAPADREILDSAGKHDMMIFSRGHAGFSYKMRKFTKKAALGKLEREMIGGSPIPMIVVGD